MGHFFRVILVVECPRLKRLFLHITLGSLEYSVLKLIPARLACVRHAASVRPEPGSNSPIKILIFNSSESKLFYGFV
jgi:hypothetical protein